MSECTHDCSSCGADCSSRDLKAPTNAKSKIKKVIAVVSGKGGVGKSTVTASLATAMAKRGRKVAVLDADITGPSIPTAFGIHERAMATEDGIQPAVTSGGIKVGEIDPRTMQSKRLPGLFFAGELIDVDAYTGGFNLQIAWATGRAAGEGAAAFLAEP